MKIVVAHPPMFDEIVAAFPNARKAGVIFSWGDTVFNPSNAAIGPALLAHEAVHGERQGLGDAIEAWWRRYLTDPAFRTAEELPAHQAEYAAACVGVKDRNAKAAALNTAAMRLASPLYGGLMTVAAARRAIEAR